MQRPPRLASKDALVIVALAIAAHATALRGGFIWLDHAHLEDGLALASPSRFLELFTRGFAGTGFYRPLMALSLSLDAAVSGAPAFYRSVTLFWHALAALGVGVCARALGLSARAALVAGAGFAVHPLTALVASATAFRSESMSLVFLLGLLVAHRAGSSGWAAAAMLGGALTKETAWLLGPLFVAAAELDARRAGRPSAKLLLVSEAAAFGLASALRWAFAPPFRATHLDLSWGEALGTRLAAFAKSALALTLPFDRGVCDAFPVTPLASVAALSGAAALAGVAWLAYRRRGVARLFALALLPALQLVPVMRWWSPHYLYVPLAFGAMLFGELAERWRGARLLVLAGAGVACAALSLTEGRRYGSDTALFGPEVTREPACREAHFFLGEAARERRRWSDAAAHYERALHPTPGYLAYLDELATLENLGAARFASGELERAKAAWSSALARAASSERARYLVHDLAVLALREGDAQEAARLLEAESTRPDALPASLTVRARALHALGRDDEAMRLTARLAH
jgi:hypothetical protein